MSPPRNTQPAATHRRWEVLATVAAFAGLAFLISSLTIFSMSNNDIWIHLKTGENVLKTWHVPDKDPYSFTASDHDYVAHEWLSGVVFYLVYAAGGVNALIFFKGAIIAATCAALFGACWFRKDRLTVLFPCLTLMLFIGSARYLERPHIFSYLFTALYLLCYFAWREGGRRRVWLYAIPVLHVVWTNLHGGHFQGILLLVMLAAAEIVIYCRARWFGLAVKDASSPSDVMLVCALPFASLAAAFVNPYGYRLLTFPFELTGQEIFMKGIYEWQPPFYPSYNLSSMFLYYCFWISVLFGSFLLVRGHSGLSSGLKSWASSLNLVLGLLCVVFAYQFFTIYKSQTIPPTLVRQALFWYTVVALFLLANFHRLEFSHASIVALFFALSMRHNRAVTDASIATLPTLSRNLNGILDRLKSRPAAPAARAVVLAVMAAGMFGLGIYTFAGTYYFSFNPSSGREMGLGIASNMPVAAVDYIVRNRITGNCFTAYNGAALLINKMWPEVKVSMDSRNDVYRETLYREYRDAVGSPNALSAYLRKWPVDFFLMAIGSDVNPQFFRYLDESADWAMVYFDDRFFVYVKNIPRFKEIIERDGYKLLKPASGTMSEVRPESAPAWLAESDRALAAAPRSLSALQYRSKALLMMARFDEAEATSRRIIAIDPGAYYAMADLAAIYLQRGQADLAVAALRRCLQIRPNSQACQEMLNRIRGGR